MIPKEYYEDFISYKSTNNTVLMKKCKIHKITNTYVQFYINDKQLITLPMYKVCEIQQKDIMG